MIKKITRLIAFILVLSASTSYSAGPGIYVGTNIGMSNLHNSRRPVPQPNGPQTTPKNNSIAGRLFVGGNITNYLGIEFGMVRYGSSNYTAPSGSSGNTHTSSFDLDGVALFPFGPTGVSVFGKFGLAFLRSTYSSSLVAPGSRGVNSGIYPLLALGASYDLTQRWVVDVSLTRVISPSKNLPGPSMFALGLSYHWTPIYCGQFLC